EEILEGTVTAESVATYWIAYRQSVTSDDVSRNSAQLQNRIRECLAIAGLDYLALAEPNSDLYLAHGLGDFRGQPIPSGTLLSRLAARNYPLLSDNNERNWTWVIETHPENGPDVPGAFLVVGGPVYLPDFDGFRYVGCIAAGKRLDALPWGEEGRFDLLLVDYKGSPLWPSFDTKPAGQATLEQITRGGGLVHKPSPESATVWGQPAWRSIIGFEELPEQVGKWESPAFLVVTEPEGEFGLVFGDFKRSVIAAALLTAILAIVLGSIFAAGLSRPLQAVALAAERYAHGDAAELQVPSTRDEIQSLAEAFEEMVIQRETTTARLIRAEKLAAWRDVARKLAHEIKNPLQPIRLQIENLARLANRNPDKVASLVPESAEIVLFEVDRLVRLADEFAAFARMPQALLAPTTLAPIIEHTIQLIGGSHPAVDITSDIPADLPPLAIDQEKVTQALLNLFKNAAEALEGAGTPDPAITCEVRFDPAIGTEIEIGDNGPGMDAATVSNLFTPYFTTKERGTGLGLVMVQQVMGEHDGTVRVESVAGKGTHFVLFFPANLIVAGQGHAAETATPPEDSGGETVGTA
ncbi:MAG: ATP-binding protein, partial [bacterium]